MTNRISNDATAGVGYTVRRPRVGTATGQKKRLTDKEAQKVTCGHTSDAELTHTQIDTHTDTLNTKPQITTKSERTRRHHSKTIHAPRTT